MDKGSTMKKGDKKKAEKYLSRRPASEKADEQSARHMVAGGQPQGHREGLQLDRGVVVAGVETQEGR